MAFELQIHSIYKCAAIYPPHVNQPSPPTSQHLKIGTSSTSTDLPALGLLVAVCDETSYFHAPGKPAKPHSCYVAQYNRTTKEAIIFLGTEHPVSAHRFLPVYQGSEKNVAGHLTTMPPYALPRGFYLNFTTPLRVYLYALPATSTLNSLKSTLSTDTTITAPPPATIPARPYDAGSFCLDPTSRRIFWEAHRSYHIERWRRLNEGQPANEDSGSDDESSDDTRGLQGGDAQNVVARGGEDRGAVTPEGRSAESGNQLGGKGLKGTHYPLGTECCDDLEWDDEDFDLARPCPIVRPSRHIHIAGVTHNLGTEGCDDLEWDDDDFQVDPRRAPAGLFIGSVPKG
ncbi:uncharacterized protein EV422DRAFT_545602 [Fimicolochytrium jonesii]|uniref:uncharacterized protein n=1 Tax=Fimicolochytrium jonesii TaxID=1396493 RepID=UPI0022FDBF12|nr:uncharacterized protein EV422DRAFT_545602 [Fimicolochytrium jonesii]KAI8816530.1 hypothetical protein EV422DRAFT_545602 [Fimicolochytrium jonesii]